jgi:hypothetical protein
MGALPCSQVAGRQARRTQLLQSPTAEWKSAWIVPQVGACAGVVSARCSSVSERDETALGWQAGGVLGSLGAKVFGHAVLQTNRVTYYEMVGLPNMLQLTVS